MSSVFEKNIEALKTKNALLAEKLEKYVLTDTPELVKNNNSYNFLYKNKFLHNPESPLGEALEIFAQAENSPVAIHLIYGLGLGYLFQVAAAKSTGTVILYEPDLNIFKSAFTLVDFSAYILKDNVFLTDNLADASEYVYQKSNMKNTPLLLSTTGYRELDEKAFSNLVKDLQTEIGRFNLDLRFTQEKFYPLLLKIIKNIPKLVTEIPIAEFKDQYKGKTVIVVSAGPTLDRDIEIIKKYRDNVILICVGTAMKTLDKHGIVPDFLCIIEANDCSKQIAGLDLSKINFITEPYSHPNLRKFKFKNTYLHIASNLPVNSFWCGLSGVKSDEYESKGTVSYTALNVARILGCSKIILSGQDLAYIEGQCYSKASAYKDLVCTYNKETKKWEITAKDFENFANSLGNYEDEEKRKKVALKRLKNLNASLYYVKGIKGDMIPTESVYAAFIRPLSEFTEKYPDREYINTSMVGAQIDGFKNLPLEEALKDSEKIENRELKTNFKYDIQSIKDNLFKSKESLKPALLILEELKKISKNLNNDLKRYKNVTPEILKNLKKLSTGYVAVGYDFSKKNGLYNYITISERINLDYEMKVMREITVDSIGNIVNKIAAYSDTAIDRINKVTEEIDRVEI